MSGMAPPPPPRGRHLTARDALIVVGIVFFVLVIAVGSSARSAGEDMAHGWERTMVMAIAEPAGWVSDQLPLADIVAQVTEPLKTGDDLGEGPGGFDEAGGPAADFAPVTPDAFDPVALGQEPEAPRELSTVLVTGDSMSMPLDAEIARALADDGIEVVRDPHVGTGLSITGIVDWGRLSTRQVEKDTPEAVIMFVGANEGFPLRYAGREVQCCSPEWAAAYATRARTLMNNYRQGGAARVYWLLLPAPRDERRQEISNTVNAAITAAAAPYLAHVRVLDMPAIFTPGFEYSDAIDVDGRETLVREEDGIHLNDEGSAIAAEEVLERMRQDFGDQVPAG